MRVLPHAATTAAHLEGKTMNKFNIGQTVTFAGAFRGVLTGKVVGFTRHVYNHTAAIYDFDVYPVISWDRNPGLHIKCDPTALIAA